MKEIFSFFISNHGLLFVLELLWTAPECLRDGKDRPVDKQKADIYALGVIFKEIFTRSSPYTEYPFLVANGMCLFAHFQTRLILM